MARCLFYAAASWYRKHAQQDLSSLSFQAMRPLSLHFRRPIAAKRAIRLIKTMQGPVGMDNAYESVIPTRKQTSPTMVDVQMVVRYRWQICIAVMAGNTIRLEIKSAPIMRIPSTIVTAVMSARTR